VTRAPAGFGDSSAGGQPDQPGDELALLERARSGDQAAFGGLVTRYEGELRLHCYRMLGSFHDAEDVMQEVLVRAWRHLPAFEGRASVRTWLYRIATNRCLTRRARPAPEAPAGAPFMPPPPNAPDVEVVGLQPFPDAWLGEAAAPAPDAIYDLRESVSLAFLTVIQLLPGRQRAVLLLRDGARLQRRRDRRAAGHDRRGRQLRAPARPRRPGTAPRLRPSAPPGTAGR
jgi:RNA polymerase sigma-70 factor (ECF subfamily)